MVEKASAAGNLGITLDPMDFVAGILGNGSRPEMPATGVSWNEAARFVNWLNTSQGFQAAYKFGTQPGDVEYNANENILRWEAGDPGYDSANRFRNGFARYFLPNVHEWYKAAYYDPHANSGGGGYWMYPTGSNAAPLEVASGTAAGTAVYLQTSTQGPADITQAGGLSPYGTMAQGGNVYEWSETGRGSRNNDDGSFVHIMRGGGWNVHHRDRRLVRIEQFHRLPTTEDRSIGFRVASVPEPGSLLLAALGAIGLLWRSWFTRSKATCRSSLGSGPDARGGTRRHHRDRCAAHVSALAEFR
jgi:formylglycine-generating enzyme required for sulfatase activity